MKKKIPLQVHEFLEPYLNKKGEYFQSISRGDFLLKYTDIDNESDFYFNVEEFKIENGILRLLIDVKPESRNSLKNRKAWVLAAYLERNFADWQSLLEGYNNVKTIFDDPISQAYADEYYDEFELVDDETSDAPLNTKQVFILDEYLERVESGIMKFITTENELEIKIIQDSIIDLRKNLTKQSKRRVIKALSVIWGHITKQGIPLVKEFIKDVAIDLKKEFVKQTVKLIMRGGDIG